MIGLSINENTRAAALDGALSFSVLLQNQRELTLDSAQSSVTGLLSAIRSAPTDYASLLQSAQDAFETHVESSKKLTEPAWTDTPQATLDALRGFIDQALDDQIGAAQSQANSALSQSQSALNGTSDPSAEHTQAVTVLDAASTVVNALSALGANQDAQAAADLASARAAAADALQQAQTLLTQLQAQNPPPAARIASTQAVIAAAQSVISAADAASGVATSSLAAASGSTPVSQTLTTDAPPTAYLTTWGTSGIVSLTDDTGRGILISPDGKVDTLPPSGQGWQFQNDATFLLADGTKLSFSPGSPASLLATRGQQRIEINNLQSGQTPASQRFPSGGLAADAARNDGYVFSVGGDFRQWTLSGAPLGDETTREVVATTPLQNEQEVDVTNVTLSSDLLAELQTLGIDANAFDENHDGRFNTRELQTLVAALENSVTIVQGRYQGALANTSAAVESLLQLNQFLEKIIADSDRRQENRQKVTAEERDQLRQIQSELNKAQAPLRTPAQPAPVPGSDQGARVLATAHLVLNQVQTLAAPAEGTPTSVPTPGIPTGGEPTPTTDAPLPALAQAFRRAERLLGGLTGTRFAEPPSKLGEDSGVPANPTATSPAAPEATVPFPASPPAPALPQGQVGLEPLPPPNGVPTPPGTTDLPRENLPPPGLIGTAAPQSPAETRPTFPSAQAPVPPPPALGSIPPAAPIPTASRPTSAQVPDLAVSDAPRPPAPVRRPSEPTGASAPLGIPAAPLGGQFASVAPELPAVPAPETPAPPPVSVTRVPVSPGDVPDGMSPATASLLSFQQDFRRRLEQHLSTYRDQASAARQLQTRVREVVEQFLGIVGRDEQLRQVFQADDLSDDQRTEFRGKVQGLERELGISWGGDAEKAPQAQANLNARVINSGMMI